MSYATIIAIADKYEICDEVLDIIYKYFYRNKIKKCTDSFTNPEFTKTWKRCIKKEEEGYQGWNRARRWDACHPGRYIILMTYRKCFFPERIYCLEWKLRKLDYIHRGPIKYQTRDGGDGNISKLFHYVDELYVNESPHLQHLDTHTRKDMIDLLEIKNKVEEAFRIKPYENFKKNMKTEAYLPLLCADNQL